MKSLRQIARELKISPSYLSDILKGKIGCSEDLMNKIKEYYPQLEFYVFTKPRYKVVNNLESLED
jgi:transcriptional regulator with XRE-family HTH domain